MVAEIQAENGPLSVADAVDAAVRPLLAAEGFELVLVEHLSPSQILRLYIDSDSEGGVGINDCTQVSRLVSDLLDAEGISDTIKSTFKLEVSSPGLDRPLVRPSHFCRFVGHKTKVILRGDAAQSDGRRKFTGKLDHADETADGGIRIAIDEQHYEIKYDAIEQARLVVEL